MNMVRFVFLIFFRGSADFSHASGSACYGSFTLVVFGEAARDSLQHANMRIFGVVFSA
jgi:hypothetical protein